MTLSELSERLAKIREFARDEYLKADPGPAEIALLIVWQNLSKVSAAADALDARPQTVDMVEAFYERVNKRAEADILNGRPITGAHHRALEAEIAIYRTREIVSERLPGHVSTPPDQ
jgi:hypothetical protein